MDRVAPDLLDRWRAGGAVLRPARRAARPPDAPVGRRTGHGQHNHRHHGPDGRQCEAAWLRTLRSTGDYVYSGCYSTRHRPGADRASVHVAFPLEKGNVQVFLRPDIDRDGSLWLRSPGEGFGTDGAYAVVHDRGRAFAACPPLREEFHVWVDDERVLRTDHQLSLWSAAVVRFHYRLDRTRLTNRCQ